jgi:hypothetical protein
MAPKEACRVANAGLRVTCGQVSISALYRNDCRLRCTVRKSFQSLLKIIFCELKGVVLENHIDSDAELQYLLKKQYQKARTYRA